MGRFICLHSLETGKQLWINADAVISVIDMRPTHNWTEVYTFAGAGLEYCVEETVESVIGLIEQNVNPLDNYVCPVPGPETVKDWSLGKKTKRCYGG